MGNKLFFVDFLEFDINLKIYIGEAGTVIRNNKIPIFIIPIRIS